MVPQGTNLMKAMKESGIDFDFPCGGARKCGKCRVRIIAGNVQTDILEETFLEKQELEKRIHLACFTQVCEDIEVELLYKQPSQHKVLSVTEERVVQIEPHLSKRYIEISKPTLGEHLSDWKRLQKSLFVEDQAASLDISIPILRQLPEVMRSAEHTLTAITYGGEVIGIEPQDTSQTLLGMAFDIGTTTIVGYLLDLYSGREIGVVSTLNPQTKFGADVISRSNYANQEQNGLEILHDTVIRGINKLIAEAVERAGAKNENIYAITIVGNTCMHHLFLGLSPRYIAKAPYIPVISDPIVLNTSDIPIRINPAGRILVLPNIAGFVGADTVGVLLAAEMDKSEEIKLIVDIGTNGEIALGSKEGLFACSAAAGPAFEGAQISSGMRGALGAIDHVFFGEKLEYSVIGEGKPQGLCGSGLLDVVAGLITLGIIDKTGKIVAPDKITNPEAAFFKHCIIQVNGKNAFLLVKEEDTAHGRAIMVTQKDIRELQLAKGAMAAGIHILMEKYGVGVEDVGEVLLAGAFGNYLNPHSACVIGLIPKELEGKIKMIGNAAGTGAKLALLSVSEYKRAKDIADSVEFVELASYPDFSSIFAKAMYFK